MFTSECLWVSRFKNELWSNAYLVPCYLKAVESNCPIDQTKTDLRSMHGSVEASTLVLTGPGIAPGVKNSFHTFTKKTL